MNHFDGKIIDLLWNGERQLAVGMIFDEIIRLEKMLPEGMKAYVIPDGQSEGVDLVINPLFPKDRVKIVHDGQYIANIHTYDFDNY